MLRSYMTTVKDLMLDLAKESFKKALCLDSFPDKFEDDVYDLVEEFLDAYKVQIVGD